jgi:acetylornithine deacetylase/succinyl-diaminopimelate desuccinylase-like protein
MLATDEYIARELPRWRAELAELLRFRSISTDPAFASDVQRTAEWLVDRLERAGLAATCAETGGHPVVLGRHTVGRDAPTLLVYAHYDVQPPEPLDEWQTPPFEPTVRGDRLYARGAADDKAQVILQLAAAEAALATDSLPINLILLFEGEEEIGSPNLVPFVRMHARDLKSDHVLIADSMMFAPGRPSLIFGMRGLAYFEIEVRIGAHDLHSGQYCGAVPNPAHALATIIDSLHDANGRVAIEGFYDDVELPGPGILEEWRELNFDERAFQMTAGDAALLGEAGFSTPERLWIRPALDVNGIASGYAGPGAKTVLPARALAKLSCRLVPKQDFARVQQLLGAHIERVTPPGVHVRVECLQGSQPWRADPSAPLFSAAARALESVFGVPPVRVAHGGTLPIAPEFADLLQAPVMVMGFALPGANMHAPNEWFPLDHLEKGIKTMTRLYTMLAQ